MHVYIWQITRFSYNAVSISTSNIKLPPKLAPLITSSYLEDNKIELTQS